MIFNMFGEMSFHQFIQQRRLTNLSINEQQKYYNNYLVEVAMHQQIQQQQSVAVAAGVAPNVISSPTPTPTPTPTSGPTATPTPTPTFTPSPTPVQLYQSYDYVISQTDLNNATGNTGGNVGFNGKVLVFVSNGYNCGNTNVRTFTFQFDTAGSYNSWLISQKTSVPVVGYYRNDSLVASGLVSTQTINATVPC